jgi:type 1 glutamine amidotransferase/sugar phosphate isomerase/epimerase
MTKTPPVIALTMLTWALLAPANTLAQAPGGGGEGRGRGQGQAAQQQRAPQVVSKSVRPSGSSLGKIRVGASSEDIWFGWTVAIPTTEFPALTFSEAAEKADALALASVQGSDQQNVSPEIPKKLSYHLKPGERQAVALRLRELNLNMPIYAVESIPSDESSRRQMFEFAKELGVQTIVSSPAPGLLADLDKLATEFEINIAVRNGARSQTPDYWNPKGVMSAIQGRGKRIGVAADTGNWMLEGIKPVDGLATVKDRLIVAFAGDRNSLGAGGHDVTLGSGAGNLPQFFLGAFEAGLKPLALVVHSTGVGDAYADMQRSLDGFENAMLPAMAARVRQVVDLPQGAIRGGDRLDSEMRAQIDAAAPRQAIVKPKKPRKLLVVDLQMYSGHGTIPHGNLMLELMAKYTNAFEATFSNDLSNLKYPKIKEFDAVFLNNVCGMVFPDAQVREGILRFVREGGGIGGNHAVTYANMNWPEFADMMGGWAGAHRVEKKTLKLDDAKSPLTAMFGGQGLEHTDEFYHFPDYAPYSRDNLHVLMSIDVEKSDMATAGHMCTECTRKDHDYGVAWIRSYGQGRVYVTPLGHTPILYTAPAWTKHMLAAVQFILGDLEADTTPSAKLAARQ